MRDLTIGQLLHFDWLQLRVVPTTLTLVFVAAAALVLRMLWSGNNRMVALESRCNTAAADVDVQLRHRHDLIPGLVETVRGFVHHEHDVLVALAQANAQALAATNPQARLAAEAQLGSSITNLLQSAQAFPELAASSHFRDLQRQLIDVENRVTAARRFVNLATEEYNIQLQRFPTNVVARLQRRSTRAAYSLGEDRAAIDAPVAFHF